MYNMSDTKGRKEEFILARTYMSIRLSYEAKYWLEILQRFTQQELDETIDSHDIRNIEFIIKDYLEDKEDALGGVSITTIFKVSASSVIEKAYHHTKNYSSQKWKDIEITLQENIHKIPKDKDVGTLAPRLYLEDWIISELERYQKEFMREDMVRVVKMSYVLKLVIYAYYLETIK